jgi:citrate lyase beta subunit
MKTVAIRSLLFLPASRPDLVPKLERFRPDVAVLDLEDAVAEADKAAARAAISDSAALAARLGVTCLVRINPPGTRHFAADLTVAADSAAARGRRRGPRAARR